MPAEIINLRKARKARKRFEKARAADINRAAHGVSKAERNTIADAKARRERLLDQARRSATDPASDNDDRNGHR